MYILEQIVNVVNWVQDFDPQNVNMQDFSLPAQLRGLDNYARNATRDYPRSSLRLAQAEDSSRYETVTLQQESPGRAKTRMESSCGAAGDKICSVQKSMHSAERKGARNIDKVRMSDKLIGGQTPSLVA